MWLWNIFMWLPWDLLLFFIIYIFILLNKRENIYSKRTHRKINHGKSVVKMRVYSKVLLQFTLIILFLKSHENNIHRLIIFINTSYL